MKGIATNDVGIQKDGAPKVSSYLPYNSESGYGSCDIFVSAGTISSLAAA